MGHLRKRNARRPGRRRGRPALACRWWLALLAVAFALPLGCKNAAPPPLRILAAQSLVDAFTAASRAYEKAHPGVSVELTTASSGQLRAQIEAGAPADVFASASVHHMGLLTEQGLVVPASRRDFAGNRLVLAVPPDSKLTDPRGLTAGEVAHIAIGDWSHVPAGRYAREVLERQDLLRALEPKLRKCQNVRQVLTYVATGEVAAGFVYQTDAAREPERVRVAWTAPESSHTPIRLPIAVVAASRQKRQATSFVDFITGPEGQAILKRHGFVVSWPTR